MNLRESPSFLLTLYCHFRPRQQAAGGGRRLPALSAASAGPIGAGAETLAIPPEMLVPPIFAVRQVGPRTWIIARTARHPHRRELVGQNGHVTGASRQVRRLLSRLPTDRQGQSGLGPGGPAGRRFATGSTAAPASCPTRRARRGRDRPGRRPVRSFKALARAGATAPS